MFRKIWNKSPNDNKKAYDTFTLPSQKNMSSNIVKSTIIYPKPQIILVDLNDDSERVLESAGYKIEVGTFGTPYKTEKSENYEIIPLNFSLPNHSEQEIIVIDLLPSKTLEKNPLETPQKVYGNSYYWGKRIMELLNPLLICCRFPPRVNFRR